MATFVGRFPQAYQEWVQAGGVENNFRKHALAIGLAIPGTNDIAFMQAEMLIDATQLVVAYRTFWSDPVPTPVTPAPTGRAADISYLTGEIDPGFCDNLKSLGIDLVIVGLQNLALANSQLSVLLAAKMKIHAYIWPQNQDLAVYMPQVYSLMIRYAIPMIWVDVEDDETNIRESIAWLEKHYQFRVGIYTSAYMWQKYMQNTSTYQALPLWYASYDNVDHMADFDPFAGWTVPTMKQYDAANTRYDLDVYDPALIA